MRSFKGSPDALPQKAFLVSSEYELKGCTVLKVGSKTELKLDLAKTISATSSIEVDPKERYFLPSSSIDNNFKETDITIESYDNQTLKSLSATIDDKAGDAVTAVIGTAIRLAAISAGVSIADLLRKPVADQRAALCAEQAVAALDRIKELEGKKKASAKAADVSALAPDLNEIDTAIAREKQRYLIHKELMHWVPTRGTLTLDLYPQEFIASQTWVTQEGIQQLKDSNQADSDGRILSLMTALSITPFLPLSTENFAGPPPTGFVVRAPAMAILRMCDEKCPTENSDVTKVLSATEHAVPQLGQYVVVPLTSKLFQNQTISLTMTADGVISKLGWKSNASGTAALQAVNTNLDAVAKAKTASDKAKADAGRPAASKDRDHANEVKDNNNAVADCLKAQKAVAEVGGTVTGSCQ